MATPAKAGGGFTANLGRIYALYTGGFLVVVLVLAAYEYFAKQAGQNPAIVNQNIGYGFVFVTIGVYALIGILTRTADSGEYYVAGRTVPAIYNGMATGADWMSAASFIGMAGTLYLLGYDGLAFVLGWTGGYVLVAILIAPFLRKFGAYTVPDFFASRYEGNLPRFLAVVVLLACSFTYVVAQIVGTGLIAQRFLNMDFELAVYVGLGGILVCSMLGGMKAVTWTQVAQYIVLIIAYLVPVVILSGQKYGIPIPQLTYGQALADIATLEQQMIKDGLATALNPATGAGLRPHTAPFTSYSQLNFFALILCLMVGTASLPHVLMRYFTTPSVREARVSVAWSLLFIFILYFTAPAYAAFAKLEVYSMIAKKTALADLPQWVFTWGKAGLVTICGKAAASVEAVKAACAALPNHPGYLRFADLSLNADAIVISTPEIAGLPYVIAGLVAAGGLAAALSTADGLLLAIANALSHDLYYKMVTPLNRFARWTISAIAVGLMLYGLYALFSVGAPIMGVARWIVLTGAIAFVVAIFGYLYAGANEVSRRLLISRVLLLVVAAFAAATAATRPADIVAMVAWAFSLAAAGIFPALVLGVWWKRANYAGCVAGMIVGFLLCLFYLVVTRYFPGYGVAYFGMTSLLNPISGKPVIADMAKAMADPNAMQMFVLQSHPLASRVGWFDVNNISSALFSLPIGFLTIIVVSLMTPRPSQAMYNMIDEIRRPRGQTVLQDKDAAVQAH
jgi:cation/acetate symporter